jgi:hypothetical protein
VNLPVFSKQEGKTELIDLPCAVMERGTPRDCTVLLSLYDYKVGPQLNMNKTEKCILKVGDISSHLLVCRRTPLGGDQM